MDFKNNFPILYKRIKRNTIIKTILFSFIVSGIFSFILSIFLWIFNLKFYISIISFVFLSLIISVITYIVKKPSDKDVARKLDELGLKQRVITMVEYEGEDSLMARIQRENAKEKIDSVEKNTLKIALPLMFIVVLSISVFLFLSTTTITALSNFGIIKNGESTIIEIITDRDFELNYSVNGSGYLVGNLNQIVKLGENGEGVLAVSYDGFVFDGWSDGIKSAYREDLNVETNKNVIANFKKLSDFTDPEDEEGIGMPTEDELSGIPIPEGAMSQNGDGGDPNSGAGGQYKPYNQVIDGDTYYGGNTFKVYNDDAIEQVQSDPELDGEIGDIILDYFSSIRQ